MSLLDDFKNIFQKRCKIKDEIFINDLKPEGYWSNLNKAENKELVAEARSIGPREAIKKKQPWLEQIIFSKKREAGLELLNLKGDEVCVDFGCMWGALSVPLAKRTKLVIAADQTFESLGFLRERIKDENIENLILLNTDIKKFPDLDNLKIDVAVVNGVLEWIPEQGDIELKKYYGKKSKKRYKLSENPLMQQISFLKNINKKLKNKGKLYLAIENRYDFKMFLGVNDPHSNLFFTSVMPKFFANIVSHMFLKRPYVNYIYSKNELEQILKKVGYKNIKTYLAFPDYRFPERIINTKSNLNNFYPTINFRDKDKKIKVKRFLAFLAEFLIFKILKLKFLAPSFIVIAET